MANDGDIPTWAAGIAAVVGGIVAAIGATFKRGSVVSTGDNDVLAVRVDDIERRLDEQDHRIEDVFKILSSINDTLAGCRADIREALTRLEERRK